MPVEKLEHRGRFAAGKDQSVQRRQFIGLSHFNWGSASFNDRCGMSCIISLNGEYADQQRRFLDQPAFSCAYQPRVCSSCDSSMAAAARPFMVPVTCSLTSARILGSL